MLTLLSPPTDYPVTLEEVKTHLRLDPEETSEDAYLEILIGAAVDYVQNYTNRQLMPATYKLTLNSVPQTIPLARQPFAAITDIQAKDALGVAVALVKDTDYTLSKANDVADLTGIESSLWFNNYKSIAITYTVGYPDAESVPKAIKSALFLIIGHLYTNREEVIVGTINGVSKFASDALLNPYRIFNA